MSAFAGVAALAAVVTAQERRAPVQTVAQVDLGRYLGTWYEVARVPNRFQRDCASDVQAVYTRRSDGRIDVTNRCRTGNGAAKDAKGVARVVDAATNARLEVRFAPAFLSFLRAVWGDYWIIGLAPDYSWATVGSPDREYLWILARTPSLPEATWKMAVDAAARQFFDTSRLVRTAQKGT